MDEYGGTDGLAVASEGGVLRITIDDPRRRNALNDESIAAMNLALQTAQNDESVRAVLLTGSGTDFCSGFDIVKRNSGGGERPRVGAIQRRLPSQAHRLISQLHGLQVPVVCGVQGYVVGIGFQLALCSDFVIADPGTTFWQPFITRGMTPDSGATWLTVRAVGVARARRLLMLGQRLGAEQAKAWGLVHEVSVAGGAGPRAGELAAQLAQGPTVALGLTRALINAAAESRLQDQLAAEALALELSSRSTDFREGLTAFVEKRDPEFRGR